MGEADDASHDLFEREAGGVDLHGVVGGAEGSVLALGVAGVAGLLGGEDGLDVLPGLGARGGARAPRRRR